MSLEAIAALLGHRSPRMTLVYARISDTVVADEYFTATSAVEADTPTRDRVGTTNATPRARHRRLLGNGHCTRPLELDCRFQTICEGCGFYETGPEFVTILRRQRDDAVAHADVARTTLYDELVRRHRRQRYQLTRRSTISPPHGSMNTAQARKITRVTALRGHSHRSGSTVLYVVRRSSSLRTMQNWLPDGSARTTQPVPSALRRSATCLAPRARTRCTSSSRLRSEGARSR